MRALIVLLMFASTMGAQAPAPQIVQGTASVGTAPAPPTGDAENGKNLYINRGCFQCHNTMAQGGGAGPRLAPRPITFPAFIKQFRQPRDEMPPYTAKVISDKEVADIYAFLSTIPSPPAANTIPILNH